jgi:small subunit ribosomal protein S2
MVDTNSDPRPIDFVIPANDDASKSIDKILSLVSAALVEGLSDRKDEKDELPTKEAVATEVEATTIEAVTTEAEEIITEAEGSATETSATETEA